MFQLLSVLLTHVHCWLLQNALCNTAAGLDACHTVFPWDTPPPLSLLLLVIFYRDQTCLSQQFIWVPKAVSKGEPEKESLLVLQRRTARGTRRDLRKGKAVWINPSWNFLCMGRRDPEKKLDYEPDRSYWMVVDVAVLVFCGFTVTVTELLTRGTSEFIPLVCLYLNCNFVSPPFKMVWMWNDGRILSGKSAKCNHNVLRVWLHITPLPFFLSLSLSSWHLALSCALSLFVFLLSSLTVMPATWELPGQETSKRSWTTSNLGLKLTFAIR